MNINNSYIGNTASEPSISNSDNEASISQLISPATVTTSQPPMDYNMPNIIRSQPLVVSDLSRVEILMRQRTLQRRRRRRQAQRRWEQRAQHQHQQLAHQIRYRQMANQHSQQQSEHRCNQEEEEEEQEAQQDRDRHNHTLRRSPTFYDLFAEVMDERLLEMYDWEMLTPENQQEQGHLFELDSTAALEQPAFVQDDAEQPARIHAFESSKESEQQEKMQMAEECNQTPLTNIQNNLSVKSFNSILFQTDQMEVLQETSPPPGTSQQQETTTEQSNYDKTNTDS